MYAPDCAICWYAPQRFLHDADDSVRAEAESHPGGGIEGTGGNGKHVRDVENKRCGVGVRNWDAGAFITLTLVTCDAVPYVGSRGGGPTGFGGKTRQGVGTATTRGVASIGPSLTDNADAGTCGVGDSRAFCSTNRDGTDAKA
eukprot:TRINITY_DN64147_c0_g1_i1.p2 TRINITY_DN64147_c0_g1~~TRINITY_DN64147_c0_g1_i1.p2  ORF type:complete len:143 (-),score=11.60 TRINITY_DN64147_c0_g1_i1:581-1009(-)